MITYPDIKITSKGWFNKGEQITNPDILRFFKQNLRRFPDGTYFIYNEFHGKIEHAIPESVESFPLTVNRIEIISSALKVYLDSGETIRCSPDDLCYEDDHTLWLPVQKEPEDFLKDDSVQQHFQSENDTGIPARLSPSAMASLMDYIDTDPASHDLKIRWPDRNHSSAVRVRPFIAWYRKET